jgi:osmotically-inducible protein OsmY
MAAAAAATALSACAPLLIGGALVGGSMVAIDRRTSGAQLEDDAIELKAPKRVSEAIGDRGSVSVTSYNRLILITGAVPTEADKSAVEQSLARIENVRSVVNELAVAAPASLSSRSNDALLTSKIVASFIDAKDLQVKALKVVTERGIVYLMGRVTEREATRAAEVARGVDGVQKVVKVFEIVTEAELANPQASPPQQPKP